MGEFKGNISDAMRDSDNMKFTTFDRDNDPSDVNCAAFHNNGWWYHKCFAW
ncbi:hypothetical protein KR215_005824 [Drosophila sulfurigaster]|nr:hypothetical protein KR215_005824 [Drosophila sulfurigaster]